MSDKPHFRLVACYRGPAAKAVANHLGAEGREIKKGPLRGCYSAPRVAAGRPDNQVNVFRAKRVGRGWVVLELRRVLRVTP